MKKRLITVLLALVIVAEMLPCMFLATHAQNLNLIPGIIGNFTDWSSDVMMTKTSDDIWETIIADLEGDISFKVRNDKEWTLSFGGTFAEMGMPFSLENPGSDIHVHLSAPTSLKFVLDLTNYDPVTFTGAMLTVDDANGGSIPEAQPKIISFTFNDDSPAYDADSNTYSVSEEHPLVLTAVGENMQQYGEMRILFYGSQYGTTGFNVTSFTDSGFSFEVTPALYNEHIENMKEYGLSEDIILVMLATPNAQGYDPLSFFALNVTKTNTYPIEIGQIENGTVTANLTTAAKGESVTLTVKADRGYELNSLSVGGTDVTANVVGDTYTFTMPEESVMVAASFKLKQYLVEFVDHNGAKLKTESVEHGKAATAPTDPTREGYSFDSWDKAFNNITGALTVTAQYTINTYTITTVVDGTEANFLYVYGAEISSPFTPVKDGYTFVGWCEDPELMTPYVFGTMPAKNITLYAKWEQISAPVIRPTFRPIIRCDGHGDMTVSPSDPMSGEIVTLKPCPDDGYILHDMTAFDKFGSKIELGKNSDGTYCFTQPSSTVTLTVTFEKFDVPCAKDDTCLISVYTDLNANEWYHDGIHGCLEKGLMLGTSKDRFDPNGAITRAMLVTTLWRMDGSPIVNYAMSFEDVGSEEWYTEAVRWAQSEGIVLGNNGKFDPDGPLTREQLATILYRYEQYHSGGFVGAWMFHMEYTDLQEISSWAYEPMCYMVMNKLIQGTGENRLDPKGTATRAEAAVILNRYTEDDN